MKKHGMVKIAGLAVVATAICIGGSTSANAALTWTPPLELSSHDVVGAANELTGDGAGTLALEMAVGQQILDLGTSVSTTIGGRLYNTGPTDYSGTLTGGAKSDEALGLGANAYNVPAGWGWVVAKYDGPKAGYVLFHLGGQAATLPEYSWSIWNAVTGQGDPVQDSYQISNFSVYNAVPEPTTMIAGALLLLPFGASTIRYFRKSRTA